MLYEELIKIARNGDLFRPVSWKGSAKCYRMVNGEIYLLDKMEVSRNVEPQETESDYEFVVRSDLVEELKANLVLK